MKILFVHPHFPGQFEKLVRHYRFEGEHDIRAIRMQESSGRDGAEVSGVACHVYPAPSDKALQAFRPLERVAEFYYTARKVAETAAQLQQGGWVPDIIYAHTGWGAGAFLHEVFPDVPKIAYCEWYYGKKGSDADFHTGTRSLDERMHAGLLNTPVLLDLQTATALMAPTEWQRSQFPDHLQERIEIVPDGIDTNWFEPNDEAVFEASDDLSFRAGEPIITYAARGADPYRGFLQFLQALEKVQQQHKQAQAIILGDSQVYYGSGAGSSQHFHESVAKVSLDPDRTHFLGRIPLKQYRKVLQVSAVHACLSVPFVMSWSALEAMSAGCLLAASSNRPLTEFLEHGRNALLSDFHDPDALAANLLMGLNEGPSLKHLRDNARETVLAHWSTDYAMARHKAILDQVLAQDQANSSSS